MDTLIERKNGTEKSTSCMGGWEGHTPQESTEITKSMLEGNHFVVDVVEGTEAFRDPGFISL